MRLLFLSIGDIPSIKHHEIYPDLLREFLKNGHEVYVVCARERRSGQPTELVEEDGAKLLKVHIGNITKTNMLEKGISTLLVGLQFKKAISTFFKNTHFDLIMYSTPPITLAGVVEYVKKRDNAKTYLLLKDIFPQNAVDIGIMNKSGVKGLLYKYFRSQEKKLYQISDRIGCMSEANVKYVIYNNPEVLSSKVEECPNCIEVIDKSVDDETRKQIRRKYGIPENKKVFVYGGNLGKPQGISFIIECLRRCQIIKDVFFLVVGDGTEFQLLRDFEQSSKQDNFKLMNRLPKDDYDTMIGACDVGLIFLDHRFTIPNFPSRLLSYMQAKIPVLAATDPHTDLGKTIVDASIGMWCESDNVDDFYHSVLSIKDMRFDKDKEWKYLNDRYSVKVAYKTIMKMLQGEECANSKGE